MLGLTDPRWGWAQSRSFLTIYQERITKGNWQVASGVKHLLYVTWIDATSSFPHVRIPP